jgi:hypothetical protein
MPPISYARHRFPPAIIQHAIWLYLRFTLSYRDVEDLLAERGLEVSYETVRRWVLKFGPAIARRLRQPSPKPSARGTWTRWRAHRRRVDAPVAGGGRRRRGAGRPGPAPAGQGRARELMRKLLKKQGFAPSRGHDRQAAVLRRRLRRDRHHGPPRAGLRKEQPGRGFAPAGAAAGTQDAAVQVARLRPALRPCTPPPTTRSTSSAT